MLHQTRVAEGSGAVAILVRRKRHVVIFSELAENVIAVITQIVWNAHCERPSGEGIKCVRTTFQREGDVVPEIRVATRWFGRGLLVHLTCLRAFLVRAVFDGADLIIVCRIRSEIFVSKTSSGYRAYFGIGSGFGT